MPTLERSTAYNRPGARFLPCSGCGKPFTRTNGSWKWTGIVVETTEVSSIRGDDEVRFFHPECVEAPR